MNSTNGRSRFNSRAAFAFCMCLALAPAMPAQEEAASAPAVVHELAGIKTSDRIQLGSQVTVCVRGLHDWIKRDNDPNSLRLFLDGHILSSSEPTAISPPSQDYVNFMLEFDNANKQERAEWVAIMDAVRNASDGRALLSVGNSSSREAFASDVYVPFELYPWFYGVAFVLVLLLLVALAWLGRTTNLLRDPGSRATAPGPRPQGRPFSLSRVQMAWWFYLVVAAYVYICLVTKVSEVPTGSVLALLGISATTGLAAVSLDKNKRSEAEIERTDLETEQEALETRIDELRKQGTHLETALQQELQSKELQLAEVNAALSRQLLRVAKVSSRGLFWDLLSDGDGVSFHRFQMVVWTVVLGLVFAWQVHRDFSMPEFDPSLLALMGVYSGTYVGFKFPEKLKV
jgi:hypothetical protein